MVFAISFCLSKRSKRRSSYANYYVAGYNGNFYDTEDYRFSKIRCFPSFHHHRAREKLFFRMKGLFSMKNTIPDCQPACQGLRSVMADFSLTGG